VRGNWRDDERRNVVEKLISGSRERLRRGKGKNRLVKNNMARNKNALIGKVHANPYDEVNNQEKHKH
jgi:hypothetical protein